MAKEYETPNYNELYRVAIIQAAKEARELECQPMFWENRVRQIINNNFNELFTGLVSQIKRRQPDTEGDKEGEK